MKQTILFIHDNVPMPSLSRDCLMKMAGEIVGFAPVARGQNQLTVTAAAAEGETRIALLGAIGKTMFDENGITEKEVRDAINSVPAGQKIELLVNSEGGSVKEGLGIYAAIKERRADIRVRITGYALSIASVFPLAAKKSLGGRGVISPKEAMWMQHQASCLSRGNADEMRETADMLEFHDDAMAGIYADATGQPKEVHLARMKKTTWTKGANAIAAGLADETDDEAVALRPLNKEFLARFSNVPGEIMAAAISAPVQGAAKPTTQPTNSSPMKKKLLALLTANKVSNVNDTMTLDELIAAANDAVTAGVLAADIYATWQAESFPKTNAAAAKPAAAAATVAANAPLITREEFDDVKNQLVEANRSRVRSRVEGYVEANKITRAEVPIFVAAALADEKGTFEILDKKEIADLPLAGSNFQIGATDRAEGVEGKALTEVINGFKGIPATDRSSNGKIITAQGRYNFLKDEWPALMASTMKKDAALMNRSGFMPVAANTYSASLVTNFLIMGVITKLGPKFAPLAAFSRDNSQDPFKPLATGQMKFNTTAQDGSTTQTAGAGTNFESNGDSTVTNVAITTAHYFENMHVSDNELNSGLRMEDLVQAKTGSFSSKIMQIVGAIITAANFTATPVIKDPTSFGWGDMRTLWGQLKKAGVRNIILDGEYLAPLQNIPTFLQTVPAFPGAGWRNINNWDFIGLNTEWSQSGANIRGFACDPQAIGIITGVPLNPPQGIPGNTLMTTYITLPGLNITIAVNVWFSLSSRQLYASMDVILGAAALDTTAGIVIASGTPS